MDPSEFSEQIEASTSEFNNAHTRELCNNLIASLPGRDKPFPVKEAKHILSLLRKKRHFDLMCQVADALIFNEQNDAQIRRQYGQALIDSKQLTAALSFLMGIVDDSKAPASEKAEAKGIIGRVYKQAYVNLKDAAYFKKQNMLDKAFAAYYDVYQTNPEDFLWHGINAVALLARAKQDKLRMPADFDYRTLAIKIRDAIIEKEDGGFASMWECGTAMEASVALRETKDVTCWAEKYITKKPDAFELTSTLRQLEEIWKITMEDEIGRNLIPLLTAALLKAKGGSVQLSAAGLIELNKTAGDKQLELVFGTEAYKHIEWLVMALDRCKAIGLITKRDGTGIGTGFVINGKSLSSKLDDDWYFLTNSHVITNNDDVVQRFPSERKPLKPDQAHITFQILFEDEPRSFRVAELLWTSPPDDLDATLLKLDKPFYAGKVESYPIRAELPNLDENPRIYTAGHPGGRRLTISIYDNHLIDGNERLFQYRTPTDPGSSGSPVFNGQWELVGLHHAGSWEKQSLSDPTKEHEANEGIRIKAIIESINSQL